MTKKKFSFFLFFLSQFFVFSSFAQTTFQEIITDDSNFSYSSGASVQQTSDGGYIVCGTYRHLLGNEANSYLVKTNSVGDTLWTKIYRDQDSMEVANSVQQTMDGGYIICGWLYDGESGYCWYVRKTDNAGNIEWSKYFTGVAGTSRSYSVVQTNDGGYAVSGYIDMLTAGLVKLDGNGNIVWTKQYYRNDAAQILLPFSIQQTSDNGFVMAGFTVADAPYNYNATLIKTDSSGNAEWTKIYKGMEGWAYSVHQTDDGGFILAGLTNNTDDTTDVCLIKTNASGSVQWSKSIGGAGKEWAGDVRQTSDKGFIISGISNSFSVGEFNYYLNKTDSLGNAEWSKIYGQAADLPALSIYPPLYCVKQTGDGGYVCSGLYYTSGTGYGLWLFKTDGAGNSGCIETDVPTTVQSIAIVDSGLSVTTLLQIDSLADRNYSVMSNGIVTSYCLTVNNNEHLAENNFFTVFPNPAHNTFVISFSNTIF